MAYENRMMDSGVSDGVRDGFPTGAKCETCGGTLSYAKKLRTKDGDFPNVDFCPKLHIFPHKDAPQPGPTVVVVAPAAKEEPKPAEPKADAK